MYDYVGVVVCVGDVCWCGCCVVDCGLCVEIVVWGCGFFDFGWFVLLWYCYDYLIVGCDVLVWYLVVGDDGGDFCFGWVDGGDGGGLFGFWGCVDDFWGDYWCGFDCYVDCVVYWVDVVVFFVVGYWYDYFGYWYYVDVCGY